MIWAETRTYFAMSTGRNTPRGQRRKARPIGIAEWMP
jgi:hypothetical protein